MRRRVAPRRAGIAAAVLVMLAMLVLDVMAGAPGTPPVITRGSGGTPPTGHADLRVTALDGVVQTGVTDPVDTVRVQLAVSNPGPEPLAGLRVVATVHRRTVSRFAFQQAMEDDVGSIVHRLEPVDLTPLPAGVIRTVELVATVGELGLDQPGQQGVYPLRIVLEQRGRLIEQITTSVVAVPDDVDEPLRLALLVPVDHPPGLLADGTYDARLERTLAPGGALDRLARELEVAPDLPMTLAPSGYLLEQIVDMSDGFTRKGGEPVGPEGQPARDAGAFLVRLRDVLGRDGVERIALPYGPADLVALARGDMADEARREVTEGVAAVERWSGQQVRRDVLWPPDGLSQPLLQAVREEGIDTVVLEEAGLAIADDRSLSTTPSPVRRLRTTSGQAGRVLVPDPFLEEQLTRRRSSPDPLVTAQRVFAETAATYFERPFASEARGLLMAAPDPPEGVLAALLEQIRTAPWLRPVDLSTLEREIEPDPQPVQLAYPSQARRRELDAAYLTQLRTARQALGSLAAVLSPEHETAGRFDRLLLAAAAVWYRDPLLQAEGTARTDLVQQTVDEVYHAVRVVEDQAVTLTSIEGQQVPVTVVSETAIPLRVRVRLEATPIAFQEGNTQVATLEPGAPTTLTFAARVLTPGGTFAANVIVEDPEGVRQLAQGSIQVRSAAYSIVALVLTAGAGAFLLLWWARAIMQRRRGQTGSDCTPDAQVA